MNHKIPGSQLNAWLLTATIGPILSVVGGVGWVTALLASIMCGALYFCMRPCSLSRLPRWLCILELVWLAVFLGAVAKNSATCWAEANAFPAIPIILLLLAAYASKQGSISSARTGATLLWLVIPILGIVFIAGTADMNLNWIRNEIQVPDGTLVGVLLIPFLHLFLTGDVYKKMRWPVLAIGAVTVAGSVLLGTVIGAANAAEAQNGFYELSKSVNLFGVAERFEALIACVLTVSWFTLFTMILSAAFRLSERIIPFAAKWSVWIVAAWSAVIMCILPSQNGWVAIGALIFWVFLPALTQVLGDEKNIEKK